MGREVIVFMVMINICFSLCKTARYLWRWLNFPKNHRFLCPSQN